MSLYEPWFSASWRRCPLWDTASWTNGLAFRPADFDDQGDPVIKIAELKGGVSGQTKRTNKVFAEKYRVKPGDVLYSWSGSPETSLDVFVWDGPEGWLNQHIFKVEVADGLDRMFHIQLLRYLRQHLVGIATNKQTTGLGHVTKKDLQRITVAVPSPEEQRRIASVLGALDDKIELNRRMNKTLERIVEIQFTERFANSAIANGEHVPVSTLFTIVSGGTPKTSVEAYWDGTIPWFSVVDTPSGGDVFVVSTDKAITEAGLASSPARLVDPWTTIISARGTVGNLAMAAEPMTFNQSCYGLVATEATGPVFVHQLAKHVVERLRAMAHGSVFSTITRSTFEAVTCPRPNPNEVGSFEALARPMYERILTAVQESATLADLRDALLPKLISGELRVPDAEHLVSEVT